MWKQIRLIFWVVTVVLAFAAGVGVSYQFLFKPTQEEVREQGTVLLERIEEVSKLITVEGYFSEIYTYKELNRYFGGAFFGKKAVVLVQAKVSTGYDLDGVEWEALPEEKIIRVKGLPEPEILSIDHDLDHYDIQEGYYDYFFDRFTEEDFDRINRVAKGLIEQKAKESDLLTEAERSGLQRLDLIRFLVEGAGWRLEVERQAGYPRIRPVRKDSIQ